MRILFITALVLASYTTLAQKKSTAGWMTKYEWRWENVSDGTDAIVDNNNLLPLTIVINYELENLQQDKPNGTYVVVPPGAQSFKVISLRSKDPNKSWKFINNQTLTYLGDLTDTQYDEEHVYFLPFATGSTYRLSQGIDGTISHQNKNAYDFTMPVGTKVHAARGGKVVEVVEKFNKGCADFKCVKFNNLIKILHEDGTVMEYLHLRKNGAKVKLGQVVKAGQLIGYSGNTGWSTGPHLHIELYLMNRDNQKATIPMRFLTAGGEVVDLEEKVEYTR